MAADLLDDSQRDACIAHLSQGSAAEAVGASSLNTDSLASLPENSGGRIAGNVSPVMVRVATWE